MVEQRASRSGRETTGPGSRRERGGRAASGASGQTRPGAATDVRRQSSGGGRPVRARRVPGGGSKSKSAGPVLSDGPGAVVDESVVVAAEQDHVAQGGCAAVDPVLDVVGVAHDRWAGAVREAAVAVAGDEGFPDRGGDQALGAADVEDLGVGAEDGGDDVGVAADPADGGGGELFAGLGGREPGSGRAGPRGPWSGSVAGRRRGTRAAGRWSAACGRPRPGVEHPGAVVAGVAAVVAAARDRAGARGRRPDRCWVRVWRGGSGWL